MANKKTETITLTVPVGATREEVWQAYKAELQKRSGVTKQRFVRVMNKVNVHANTLYNGDMDILWGAIYDSQKLRPLLTCRQARKYEDINYYNVLSILSYMKTELRIFQSQVSLKCLAETLIENPQLAVRYYRGRSSYEGVVDERVVRRVITTNLHHKCIFVEE